MSKHEIHNNKTDGKKIIEPTTSIDEILLNFNNINSHFIQRMKEDLSHLIPTVIIGNKESLDGQFLDTAIDRDNISPSITDDVLDALHAKLRGLSDRDFEIFISVESLLAFERSIPKDIQNLRQECFHDIYNKMGHESMHHYSMLLPLKKKIYDLYEFFEQVFEDVESDQCGAEQDFLDHVHEYYPDEAYYFGSSREILAKYDYFCGLDDYYDPDNHDAVPARERRYVPSNNYLYD